MSDKKSSSPQQAAPAAPAPADYVRGAARAAMNNPKGPKGVPPDASEELRGASQDLVGFLKDPANKRALTEFVMQTYRQMESERIERMKARVEKERETDAIGALPHHKPGNIGPMLDETLNMAETEMAFARGIRATHQSLTRHVEARVEEINRLLAGIGGFSSQLKSCFARSTVVFLEQDDPKYPFRERLVFSVHLPNYELKREWGKAAEGGPATKAVSRPATTGRAGARGAAPADGRTVMQATWDDAVNALAAIIQSAGLKPKYCKNDRNYGRFVMKQDLQTSQTLPDEYFSLTLDYNTNDKLEEMRSSYNRIVRGYDKKIEKLQAACGRYPKDSKALRYLRLRKKLQVLINEKNYFEGTVPDPNQLDEGLLFLIEVSTLKDYHIVKDRMQSIMTKFILHLSKIAEKEAEFDPDLEYEKWKSGARGVKSEPVAAEDIDLEGVEEYIVDAAALRPVKKAA